MAKATTKYTPVLTGDLSLTEVRRQEALLKGGAKRIQLERPCTIGDGIRRLRTEEYGELDQACRVAANDGRLSSFVPASGAATRMMAALVAVYGRAEIDDLSALEKAAEQNASLTHAVKALKNFEELPVWPAVKAHIADNGLEDTLRNRLSSLLDRSALDAANTPKALIPFHTYGAVVRTPLFEHIQEAAAISRDAANNVPIHFTVSAQHEAAARAAVDKISGKLTCTYR